MSTALTSNHVHACRWPAEYEAAAGRWSPGAPFPVLAGPSLERYRAILPGRALPAVRPAKRAGRVVSTGGDVSRSAARLLAVATGRPHRHLAPHEVLDDLAGTREVPSAVVGLPDELAGIGDWPGRDGGLVGVLTGRTEAALSCLVYRSLTAGAGVADRTFFASHPLLPGAMEADAVSIADLAYLRGHRPALVVLSGQGRECCTSLLDGMVCGRSEPLGVPLPAGALERTTPCMSGQGCFRTDLTADDLIPAAEINAQLALVHSCSAVAVGTNAFPAAISVTLGLLDGTTVAVIGALGVHLADRYVPGQVQDALAEGVPLGEIVRLLHHSSGGNPLMRFGLLGDPAQVLPAPAHPAPVRRRRAAQAAAVIAGLTRLNDVLIRLQRLHWLEVPVPAGALEEIREQMRRLCADPSDPQAPAELVEMEKTCQAVQMEILERLIARIHGPGWDPGWRSRGFRYVEGRPAGCPSCLRPIATNLLLRHPLEPALFLRTLQCRRCGDVWWHTGSAEPPVAVVGPLEITVSRGPRAEFARELVNRSGDTVPAAAGFSFRRRKNLGLPPGAALPVTLPPYGRYRWKRELDLVTGTPPVDTHSMLDVVLCDGELQTATVMLRLVEDQPTPGARSQASGGSGS